MTTRKAVKGDKEQELRKRAKALTIPKLEASMSSEAKEDAQSIQRLAQSERLGGVVRLVRITEGDAKESTKKMKRYGASPNAVSFGRGVRSGLRYAGDVAQAATKPRGRIMNAKGQTRTQRRGSVIK